MGEKEPHSRHPLDQEVYSKCVSVWHSLVGASWVEGSLHETDFICLFRSSWLSLTFERRQDLEDWSYCWPFGWVCSDPFFSWLSLCSSVSKYSSVPHSYLRFWVSLIPVKVPCWCSGNERGFFHVLSQVTTTQKEPHWLYWNVGDFVAL